MEAKQELLRLQAQNRVSQVLSSPAVEYLKKFRGLVSHAALLAKLVTKPLLGRHEWTRLLARASRARPACRWGLPHAAAGLCVSGEGFYRARLFVSAVLAHLSQPTGRSRDRLCSLSDHLGTRTPEHRPGSQPPVETCGD